MTVVNTSGFVILNKLDISAYTGKIFSDLFAARQEAMAALRGQQITIAEWNRIVEIITILNKHGFQHADLIHNLFFRRNEAGKLIITIIDFEHLGNYDDMVELNNIRLILEGIGAKVPEGSWDD